MAPRLAAKYQPQRISHTSVTSGSQTTTREAAGPSTTAPPAIFVDTSVTTVELDKSKLSAMSPGVRDVAEHAAQLKMLLTRVGAIYDMVGRQASQMAEISPAVLGRDQITNIRTELASKQELQKQKLAEIQKRIETEKENFIKHINGTISEMIKKVVASQIKQRVKEKIQKHVEPYSKLLKGNSGRMLRHQLMFDNIEAKIMNATIRSKWPREPITPIMRPLSIQYPTSPSPTTAPATPVSPTISGLSASQNFPENFEKLLGLTAAEAIGLMNDYNLPVSDNRREEDRHFENLNRLMSHFGIGYRVNPGGPKPILTSLWDRR